MVKDTNVMMNNTAGEASLLPDGFHNWQLIRDYLR